MSAVAASAAVVIPSPRSEAVAVDVLPALWVPENQQWVSSTSGRIVLDGYSWMQAVHWVAGSGLYEPRRHRSHGPRSFGVTTVRVAQELAELSPCRPGIEYLVRRTGLSERAVEYHLAMLRESGLLAYVVRGTRVRGERARASEFERVVPPEFDAALGIRTAGEGVGRRMTGIAEAGRELMAKLARKASRKVRKPRAKSASKAASKVSGKAAGGAVVTGVSVGSRCTPMEGGTTGGFSAGSLGFPPENELASGERHCPTPKKPATGRRMLNRVGRRYQLAAELVRQVPWLRRASTARIAWVVREVADAGWTATEVMAWLDTLPEPKYGAARPSGLLAYRLKGMAGMPGWTTPELRARAVQEWRESHLAEHIRHDRHTAGWDADDWQDPTSEAVRRLVAETFAPRTQQADQGEGLPALDGVDDLSEEERADMRATALREFMAGETTLVQTTLNALGRPAAERIYGARLVQRVVKLASGTSLMTIGRR